jgi:hypothetical protein
VISTKKARTFAQFFSGKEQKGKSTLLLTQAKEVRGSNSKD